MIPGRSLGVPGSPLGSSWASLEGPWASLGFPRDPPGPPGISQGPSLDASVGAMGALKNIEKPLVFIAFPELGGPWGGPGESLGVHRRSLGVPWGSLGVLGTSLGGSEWSLGVDVSATDHFVMYTGGNMMFLWSLWGSDAH